MRSHSPLSVAVLLHHPVTALNGWEEKGGFVSHTHCFGWVFLSDGGKVGDANFPTLWNTSGMG